MTILWALLAVAQSPQEPAPPAPAASVAIDPARPAAARRLLDLVNTRAMLDRSYTALAPAFANSLVGAMATDASAKPELERLLSSGPDARARLIAIMSDEFVTAMRRQYPAIEMRAANEYAAQFSTEELNQINAFYASGVGAKALRLLPAIQMRMSEIGRELGREAGAEAGRRGFERAERELTPAARNK